METSNAPIFIIEILLVGGLCLGFGFWQLWSLRRDKMKSRVSDDNPKQ